MMGRHLGAFRGWGFTGALFVATMIFTVVAVAQDVDSNRPGEKLPIVESIKDKLPGPDDFIEVKTMPAQTHVAEPVYPEAAKKAGVEGEVWIKALVDQEGRVVEARVRKKAKVDDTLSRAALDAAKKCRYQPAIGEDGKPVAIWVSYKVVFALKDCKRKSPDDVD